MVGALVSFLALFIFPQQVVAVMAIIYLACISGFLHLDGLADSGDGLFSGRPKEASLLIMKDSRTGAMGVVVVVCVFLAKFAALSAMDSGALVLAVFFMPLVGRCAILLTMARLPYARAEGGLGQMFYSDSSRTAAILAFLALIVLLVILARPYLLAILTAVFAINVAFGRWCKARLGGATGDTLGAVCELTEAGVAIAFTVTLSSI